MKKGVLTEKAPDSGEFEFSGECCICLKGRGSASIMRQMGSDFEVMTTEDGTPMTYGSSDGGVMFNNSIRCNKRLKYKIVSQSSSEVEYSIIPEER